LSGTGIVSPPFLHVLYTSEFVAFVLLYFSTPPFAAVGHPHHCDFYPTVKAFLQVNSACSAVCSLFSPFPVEGACFLIEAGLLPLAGSYPNFLFPAPSRGGRRIVFFVGSPNLHLPRFKLGRLLVFVFVGLNANNPFKFLIFIGARCDRPPLTGEYRSSPLDCPHVFFFSKGPPPPHQQKFKPFLY